MYVFTTIVRFMTESEIHEAIKCLADLFVWRFKYYIKVYKLSLTSNAI